MNKETRKLIEQDSRDSFCDGLKERYAQKCSDNQRIFAEHATKQIGPYYCPSCFSDAIVRKDRGSGRIDHFAHIATKTKIFKSNESELHLKCKNEICDALKLYFPDGNWKVERPIPGKKELDIPDLVPDISGRIVIDSSKGKLRIPVVIEVQRSFLQIPIIHKRTVAYSKRIPNVYILWVIPLREELQEVPFRPRLFERYLHSMYYGRIYYWWQGLGCNVKPVHFGKTKRHIPSVSWRKDGEEHSAGGYDKTYKTIKIPVAGDTVNIADEMIYTTEPEFYPYANKNGKQYKIPKRNIYWDGEESWWELEPEYIRDEDKQLEGTRYFRYYIDDYSLMNDNVDTI